MSGRIRPRSTHLPHRVDSNSGALARAFLARPRSQHTTLEDTMRGKNAQTCSAIRRMVFDQESFTKNVWQSTMFSSKLYQCSATSDTFFMPPATHQYDLTYPPGFKREITLELEIHTQFNSVKVRLLNSNMIQHSSTVFCSSYIPTLLLCVLNLITIQQKQPITLSALEISPPVLVQAVDYNLIKPIC